MLIRSGQRYQDAGRQRTERGRNVRGDERAASGSVAWLQLEASNEYVMLTGSGVTANDLESGTYALNADLTQVTFTPDGPDPGAPSTHDFAVTSTARDAGSGQSVTMGLHELALVTPIAGSLVQTQAQSLTVDGASVQLVDAVQMRCPDGSRLIFPDLASAYAATAGRCMPRTTWGGL